MRFYTAEDFVGAFWAGVCVGLVASAIFGMALHGVVFPLLERLEAWAKAKVRARRAPAEGKG